MKKLVQNQAVRYIFFGGCTTMVNLVTYYLLRHLLKLDVTQANTLAIFLAILFAYVVNKLFVFEHQTESVPALLKEAGSFIGMRLGTMVVEVFGVILMASIWGMNDMLAKLIVQFVILVLNYLISKLFVFCDREPDVLEHQSRRQSWKFFGAGFGITVLIAGIGFAYLEIWPFGDKILLIIDSLHQYLPFYTDMQSKLADSESLLFSFSGGLGYNFWSTYAYYLASPLNFLMAFVPKEHVCDFMDLMILVKIGLCGGTFSWYLHKRDPKRVYMPVVFGVMFALSNFVIGYYFNLMWLDSIAVLPLIMFGIEQIVKGKSGKIFGLSLFYGLWCNYYIGFMLCIFSCLYFLVRWISAKQITWKKVGKSCLSFGWYALLAGGMSALVLLPAYMGLSTSESMQGNSFPSVIKFYENLAQLLENHMAFMEPVNISNSQVGLNVYCGVATILLAVLYLFDKKIRLRERLAHYGLCALFLLSFAFNILNYVWHGFHVQNGLPNRFAFLYIAILLVMAYDAAGHLYSFAVWKLLIAFAAPAAFVVWRSLMPEQEIDKTIFLITLGLLLLYFSILLIGVFAERIKFSIFSAILSAILLVEAAANGIYGISCDGNVTRSIYLADQSSYQAMMETQEDNTFFRSEVDRQRMRNVTMFVGGNAMVMFNSTMHGSLIDLCDSLGIEARTNKNGYLGVTKLMNDVFGIKYVASPSKTADTLYQFEQVAEDGDLRLYKNDSALSLGFMVDRAIYNWDTTAGEPLQVQNSFVQLATGLESIFVLDRYIDMEDGENYGIKIPENKQVYLCIDTRVKKIELNTPEYTKSFSDYTDHLYVINGNGENNMADFTVTLKDSQDMVRAEVYTCANDAYQQVVDTLAESQLTEVEVSGNTVKGQINAKEDGVLLLTIPYDDGWKIRVDGKVTSFEKVGGALIGIDLEAGEHTISMKYTPPGLWMGSALSLLCLLLFLLSSAWSKRHPAWFEAAAEDDELELEVENVEDAENALKVEHAEGAENALKVEHAEGALKVKNAEEAECAGTGLKAKNTNDAERKLDAETAEDTGRASEAEHVQDDDREKQEEEWFFDEEDNWEGERDMQELAELLRRTAGENCILEQESMKKHTTFRIGGPADLFAVPETQEDVAKIVRICREKGYPFYVLGNGSNLLVSDEGYRGLILQLYRNYSKIEVEGNEITVQAGAMLSVIAKRALEHGLTGFEFASGIPGTIGGAVVMNAGAYGGEMKDVLTEVTVLTKENEIRTIAAKDLELGYRTSAVMKNGWIVLGAKIRLQKGNPEAIRARIEELKEQRVAKQPLEYPSAGSTFKRPEGYFAGKLIMDAGLRGFSVGDAQVSEKHCGFVINKGNATAADVQELIKLVTEKVEEQFHVTLEPEVKMLGM